jgi:flagellar FliJ protein
MATPFPLQTLLDLSQLHLEKATRELGELIAGEHQASTRYALLVRYRDEYHSRFLLAAENGLGLSEWSNYTRFIARIDDAIVTAAQSVAQTQQRTLAGQQDWMGKQGRVKAFSTLADRHQAVLAGEEQRAEQKASDEFGARSHANKNEAANAAQPTPTALTTATQTG